jgi:hypothetical protein
MSKLIQFTHPGQEHGPDNKEKNFKSWNNEKHRRKFLKAKGKYVLQNNLEEGILTFWGEWEPPSKVEKLNSENKLMPKWLHEPVLPAELPIATGYQQDYQNTDPLVFGKQFRYFVCKQFKDSSKKATGMAKLERGDVVLFGSISGKKAEDAFFQLDTVFVVDTYIEYDPSDPNALNEENEDRYKDFVYKMAFPQPTKESMKLRLYKGATFNKPVNGMYSFVPAKVYSDSGIKEGFSRVPLKDLDFITNNLNSAAKHNILEPEQIKKAWELIRDLTIKHGCVEGVSFEMPKTK